MTVRNAGDQERHYFYDCSRQHTDYGLDRCNTWPGGDRWAGHQEVLAALQPAALELSVEAARIWNRAG